MKCRKTATNLQIPAHEPVPGIRGGRGLASFFPSPSAPNSRVSSGWFRYIGSQRGVALVLTLIMLAVITIITVLFLATARRNRSSTTVRIDQTTAEFAAETAYQHATGKIIERILNDRDLLSFDFFVSRPLGYGYVTNNGLVSPAEPNSIPRVTNDLNTVGTFLDLNRTKRFDDPGDANRPFGDPIWLGILDRPWLPHSNNNRFVARIAYLVLPVGKSLDLNTIHNAAGSKGYPNLHLPADPDQDYRRNQGFGPWELNLAAFLHEFNPGLWDYSYYNPNAPTPASPIAVGAAFHDARTLLDSRHGWYGGRNQLGTAYDPDFVNFGSVYSQGVTNFPPTSIDIFGDGMYGIPLGADISYPDNDSSVRPAWPGADSTNHWYHIQQLFDVADVGGISARSNKVTRDFFNTLSNTLAADGTAYYRMLAQLGTDTGSDLESRINLNFADKHANFPNTNFHATNFVSWDASLDLAVAFYTNVAQRIFRAQSNEFNTVTNIPITSINNIPVSPTNLYSSALHRILQESANIYDATRTNALPTVFLPLFRSNAAGVYIHSYIADASVAETREWMRTNTYGIPPVVGAKKFLPNFNEYSLLTDFLLTRKLQIKRAVPGGALTETNQMYVFGVSNVFGVEAWNSYRTPYNGRLRMEVTNEVTVTVVDKHSVLPGASYTNNYIIGALVDANTWPARAFRLPLTNQGVALTNSIYNSATGRFTPVKDVMSPRWNVFERGFALPYMVATISNRVTYLVYDETSKRVLDCVVLKDGMVVDFFQEINRLLDSGATSLAVRNVWETNVPSYGSTRPSPGLLNQIQISAYERESTEDEWKSFNTANTATGDKALAIAKFADFMGLTLQPGLGTNSLEIQTGFNPTHRFAVVSSWQANDPLVHYHPSDLFVGTNVQLIVKSTRVLTTNDMMAYGASLGFINTRYAPWGGKANKDGSAYDATTFDRRTRDAGVFSPDEWHFPNNKFASVGLLGRVHRGTPWQTIYFKPEAAPLQGVGGWLNLAQDYATNIMNGRPFASSRSHPTNDWLLADIFTTALDERTTRGLVSMNQTNLETWSAALSGILVLSNSFDEPQLPDRDYPINLPYDNWFIAPSGGLNNGFFQIWTNIYRYQLAKGSPIGSVGELLQNVPELTINSPFLNTSSLEHRERSIDDFAYEQIPQQILSLLRVGQSRFVVYAYGQALKPESIDPASGAVRNYQVTAEFATRTVLRVEGDPSRRVRVVVESFNILPPD